jgi:transcriptional regulator with XRE-family HTH domain
MAMEAAGSYLRTLREQAGVTRSSIARTLGTSSSQIERIEEGRIETRASLLLAFVRVVGGSAEHLTELVLSRSASAAEGRDWALRWLASGQTRVEHKQPSKHIKSIQDTSQALRLMDTDQLINIVIEVADCLRSRRVSKSPDSRSTLLRSRPRHHWKPKRRVE